MYSLFGDLDLPELQSIELGEGALSGNEDESRRTRSKEPYYFKNTMTMKGNNK